MCLCPLCILLFGFVSMPPQLLVGIAAMLWPIVASLPLPGAMNSNLPSAAALPVFPPRQLRSYTRHLAFSASPLHFVSTYIFWFHNLELYAPVEGCVDLLLLASHILREREFRTIIIRWIGCTIVVCACLWRPIHTCMCLLSSVAGHRSFPIDDTIGS